MTSIPGRKERDDFEILCIRVQQEWLSNLPFNRVMKKGEKSKATVLDIFSSVLYKRSSFKETQVFKNKQLSPISV